MYRIRGKYCLNGRSQTRPAMALLRDDGTLRILATDADSELICTNLAECRQGEILPGLPVELHFPDGDSFVPDDADVRWSTRQGFLAYCESHLSMVILAALLVPLSFWLVFTQVIPAGASATAPLVPQSVLNQIGGSALKTLDFLLQDSELTAEQQEDIIADWQAKASAAGLNGQYQVVFRRGDEPVINAFALADGTIVLFDGLVKALPREQLIAVLFHEAGHVDLRHHIQMIIQTSAGAIVYGLLLGNLEGLSETVLGAGLSLGENAFSRKMETQADDFAAQKMRSAGLNPEALAEALNTLPGSREETNSWREFLSTHPDTDKRVDRIQHSADTLSH